MVRLSEMAEDIAAAVARCGYSVFTEAPERTGDGVCVYIRVRPEKETFPTAGICQRNIRAELICMSRSGLSNGQFYTFIDDCLSAFRPYASFCGRCIIPEDAQCSLNEGVGRYSFSLRFADDIEPISGTPEEERDPMRYIDLKEEF